MNRYPGFIEEITSITNNASTTEIIGVDRLRIHLWPTEPGHLKWLMKYLGPLLEKDLDPNVESVNSFKVGSIFSDEIVSAVARFIESGSMDYFSVWNGKRYVNRLVFSPTRFIDHDMEPGTVCTYDLEANTVTLITSAHTEQGMHELGRCIRDLATNYLRGNGWDIFHAGGFQVDRKNYLVLGNKGAGKTSLIVAMLYAGANFIANDRVFIKSTEQGLQVKSFPMTVAIGLGTALQYPQLKHYISHPGSLTYPRRRFDIHQVSAYPENRWHELPDKLQLFPGELLQLFGDGSAIAGGDVDGIIFPQISDFQHAALEDANRDHARDLILNNYFPWQSDDVIPAWRPFNFPRPDDRTHKMSIEKMLELPIVNFEFLASKNLMQDVRRYPDYLQEFLSARAA